MPTAFLNMSLLSFLRRPGRRFVQPFKPGTKVEHQPTIAYNPKKREKPKSHKFNRTVKFPWKKVLVGLLVVVILLGLVIALVSLFQQPHLTVKNFKLLGNRTINDTQVLEVLSKYKGKSILLLQLRQVEADLSKEFNIFNGVTVTKQFPDTVFVRISEREPKLVYINLSGAFLVDANGLVLQQIFTDPIDFSPEKMNISRGLGNPESDFLKQQMQVDYLSKMNLLGKTPEEQQADLLKNFDFSLLPLADKQAKLVQLQKTYLTEVDALWDRQNQAVDVSVYSTYPRVNVLESTVLEQRSEVSLDRLILTTDILSLFQSRKVIINKVIWEGSLLIKFSTIDNIFIVFGLNRKVSDQFEDYLLVSNQLKREGKNNCEIDVSAVKIAVRSCH